MKYPIALAALMICFISFPAAAQLAEAAWPMFHHDLNHTGLSTGYGPDTSAVNWTFSTGERIFGSAAIGADDTIYIGTRKSSSTWGSKLYAIYPNGTEKWHWSPNHAVDFIDSTPTIASDGTIYIGSWDRNLYALYPNSTMKWKFYTPCGGFVLTSPAISPDGTIYIGNKNNNLYAINPDGSLKWTFLTGKNIESSPAVGHDGTIYVGSLDRKLYAIYPDGSIKWSYTTDDKIKSSPAIGEDDTVYVGSNDGKLYAIYPNGTLKWSYTTGDCIISSPAIDADGMVYVGSNDGKLYAIYPNGTLKWVYAAGGCIVSSPAIDADGTVYVGSFDGHVHAINQNGALLWKYYTENKIFYSSPSIAADGTVYIGNWGGDLYAFGPGTPSNRPPVLDPIGNKTVNENSLLEFTVNAADPDGDALTYSIYNLPAGAVFNPDTMTFTWIPGFDQAGTYNISFHVSDADSTDSENISITVNNINRPPVLDPIGEKVVNENSLLEFTVNGADPDGDALTYSTYNLPAGAVFDPDTMTFTWTPGFDQAGTYNISFHVSDADSTDSENITITVNNTNRPPVLDPIGEKVVNENSLLEFTVNGADPDGDALTYLTYNLPAGAVFDPDTMTFTWTPGFDQAGTYGTYNISFHVSDADSTDSENITIIVNTVFPRAKIEVAGPSECIGLSKQFDILIKIDPNGTYVYGIEYELSFNSTVIHAEWQDDGDFLKQGGASTNVYVNNIDNIAGKASFAMTKTGISTGATEPGTLATIHFTSIQIGSNTILDLISVKTSDPDSQPILVDFNNSEVEVCDNKPPVVIGKTKFKYNNLGTKYMSRTYFDGSESDDPDGNIINYRWYFGEGNYGSGETVEYIYGSWMWNTSTHSYDPFTTILTVEDDSVPMMDNSTKIPVDVYIAGDANGDGEVDIFDATLVGLKWDAVCGPDGWDTDQKDQADLNNDCAVDIFDAVIIGANWDHIAW